MNVRPNQIEVLSFPGPLSPVDNKMLKKKHIVSREYRNRRIGDFLKELQLTEGPCSTSELLEKLGLESRTGAFRRNIKNLMENVLIEYVYPDNPKHPEQKYRLKQHD